VIDTWASAGERLQLAFSWTDPLATCVLLGLMLALAAGLWLLGLQVLVTAGLLWVFRCVFDEGKSAAGKHVCVCVLTWEVQSQNARQSAVSSRTGGLTCVLTWEVQPREAKGRQWVLQSTGDSGCYCVCMWRFTCAGESNMHGPCSACCNTD
jgi:hypothetical protein